MTKEITAWLAALRPGDRVGTYARKGSSFLYESVVERKTPSGRVVCIGGSVFRPDGYKHIARDSRRADLCIKPL